MYFKYFLVYLFFTRVVICNSEQFWTTGGWLNDYLFTNALVILFHAVIKETEASKNKKSVIKGSYIIHDRQIFLLYLLSALPIFVQHGKNFNFKWVDITVQLSNVAANTIHVWIFKSTCSVWFWSVISCCFFYLYRVQARLSAGSTSTPLPKTDTSTTHTPTHCLQTHTPSSIHSRSSLSPIHHHLSDSPNSRNRSWINPELSNKSNFEPKNLLTFFDEVGLDSEPWLLSVSLLRTDGVISELAALFEWFF